MRVDIAWWDLDGTGQTIESLRAHLRDDAPPWAGVSGLRLKFWVADEEHNRWGAVMVWESVPPAALPPNRAAELIGGQPDHRLRFDVEAVIEGSHELPVLHGLGPALA